MNDEFLQFLLALLMPRPEPDSGPCQSSDGVWYTSAVWAWLADIPKNINTPETPPTPNVDWDAVRREHGRPNEAAQRQFEADIAKLDETDATRGGCGS